MLNEICDGSTTIRYYTDHEIEIYINTYDHVGYSYIAVDNLIDFLKENYPEKFNNE